MTMPDLISYFTALLAINLAPGPILLLLIVRATSNDTAGALCFALGTALGSLTILTAVCFGMSLWFDSHPELFGYSKYLMLAYICWIGRNIWTGGFDMTGNAATPRSGLLLAIAAGFVTCVTSPFMLILFPLVLPEVMDITSIRMPDFLFVSAATLAAEMTVAALAIGLALQLRRLSRSARAMLILNRGLAALLVSVGGWMALA